MNRIRNNNASKIVYVVQYNTCYYVIEFAIVKR